MKPLLLKYFSADKNAGDLASPYLFGKISGVDIVPIVLNEISQSEHYMGVGSTLAHADAQTIVWGTGIMKPTLHPKQMPKRIIGVRGHLTASRLKDLGYGQVPVVGDAGLLVSHFFCPESQQIHPFGFIPHYVDEEEPFCQEVRDLGGVVISPQQDLEPYLNELAKCRVIISSSLHGLIFAHSYGIPAIWVKLSDRVVGEGFKFRDYFSFLQKDPDQIPFWDHDNAFSINLARANCPAIPRVNCQMSDMLFADLNDRGYC